VDASCLAILNFENSKVLETGGFLNILQVLHKAESKRDVSSLEMYSDRVRLNLIKMKNMIFFLYFLYFSSSSHECSYLSF